MSQVEDIIRYAREGAGLFHAPDGTAYAAVEVDGHLETHAIRSVRFRDWILIRFLHQHGKAPNTQFLNDALNTIRAIAVYHGPEMPVFVRVAEHEGDVYVDLGMITGMPSGSRARASRLWPTPQSGSSERLASRRCRTQRLGAP